MKKGSRKGREKGWEKRALAGGFTVALFDALFFLFPAELQVEPRFCWSTLFVLLIEKGEKPGKKRREWQKRRKRV
jgi:hypothetical protein